MATVGRNAKIGALGLLAVAIFVCGCGSAATGGDYGGQHPDYKKDLAGSPPALAALHRQSDQLLDGGKEAFEKRLEALHGYPVVVNIWASWCGPCRAEFSSLQQLSAKYGKKVAFLGVNSQDGNDTASTFLSEAPVPYPSYTDPNADVKEGLGARGYPDTAFYDRNGDLAFLRQGQYANEAELNSDIERCSLREECESG